MMVFALDAVMKDAFLYTRIFPNQPAEVAQSNERRKDFKRKTESKTVVFGLIVVIWF